METKIRLLPLREAQTIAFKEEMQEAFQHGFQSYYKEDITKCAPTVGPKDGSFTLQYRSATAVGKAEIVTDREEKIAGLRAICQRFPPHHMDAFDDAIARSLERTAVVRITLTEPPVGKRKQYDKEGEEMKWGRME